MTRDTRRIELEAQLKHLEATRRQAEEVLEAAATPATREQAKADLRRAAEHIAEVQKELEGLQS